MMDCDQRHGIRSAVKKISERRGGESGDAVCDKEISNETGCVISTLLMSTDKLLGFFPASRLHHLTPPRQSYPEAHPAPPTQLAADWKLATISRILPQHS